MGLDFDFHAAIGAATGNPYFSAFLDFIGSIIIPRRTILVDANAPAKLGAYLARVREEHDAIAAGDRRRRRQGRVGRDARPPHPRPRPLPPADGGGEAAGAQAAVVNDDCDPAPGAVAAPATGDGSRR